MRYWEAALLEVITIREIERIFEVTDALGIHREEIVIPLAPGSPGGVTSEKGKLRIVVDAAANFEVWVAGLEALIRAAR